jgi:hypothetical protein
MKMKAAAGFIGMIILSYLLLTFMGLVTPEIIPLRAVLTVVILVLNFTLLYYFVKPVRLLRFNIVIISILLPLTVVLTFINHTTIHHDLNLMQIIMMPVFVLTAILSASLLYYPRSKK